MRFNSLTIVLFLFGIAGCSTAMASDSALDITINVVGPNQNVQGAIENRISIPQGHSDNPNVAVPGARGENLQENSASSETSSEAQQATQQTQDSVQQLEQQDTQDTTQQTQPDN